MITAFNFLVAFIANFSSGITMDGALADFTKLDEILKSGNYNSNIRPITATNEPTKVYLGLFVHYLSSVSEINMDYQVELYLRQSWRDERLTTANITNHLNIGHKYLSKIWLPDLYFTNEKHSADHTTTVPNVMLTLGPDGTVFYSLRLTVTLSCALKFRFYPFDTQTCFINMMSYGHTESELEFVWATKDAVQNSTKLELPEYQVSQIHMEDCTETLTTGTYSCLSAVFTFKREISSHIIQTYLPSIAIVLLSWVSFWIDHHSVPARISIGLLTLLTMITQASGTGYMLPKVSYLKAIDIWMSSCLLFVFVALVEYLFVNIFARKRNRLNHIYRRQNFDNMMQMEEGKHSEKTPNQVEAKELQRFYTCIPRRFHEKEALYLDVVSRMVFPAMFMLFNLGYWIWIYFG